MSSIDWASLVFDQQFMAGIDKLAARRFGQGGLAEEAATYVVEYLSEDEWEKCSSFQGKAKPTTFLFTLVSNAIEEYSRKRFGRPRPPVWLQDLGDIWVKLWRSLCLERQLLPSLVERFSGRGFREPKEVEQAAKVIKARIPGCGQTNMESMDVEDIDRTSDIQQAVNDESDDSLPVSDADNPFLAELFAMVSAVVNDSVCCSSFERETIEAADNIANRFQNEFEQLKQSLQLSDQERVMLKMIYVDGMSKTATSKALGMPAHQAGRIVNDALARINDALHECEMDLELVLSELN